MLCDVMLLAHQRVHVLQVMATVARGYGWLTGFPAFFSFLSYARQVPMVEDPYSIRATGR